VRKTLTKDQRFSDGQPARETPFFDMGYYVDGPPRHSHRTPSELAEDEVFSGMHGNVRMPASMEETEPRPRYTVTTNDAFSQRKKPNGAP
jgi:hypothetical protein